MKDFMNAPDNNLVGITGIVRRLVLDGALEEAIAREAIVDTPVEAKNMKLRSGLMMGRSAHITHTVLSQVQAAKLFGVTQPSISDLDRGKIKLFGLDALVNMASVAGMQIEMRIQQAA